MTYKGTYYLCEFDPGTSVVTIKKQKGSPGNYIAVGKFNTITRLLTTTSNEFTIPADIELAVRNTWPLR